MCMWVLCALFWCNASPTNYETVNLSLPLRCAASPFRCASSASAILPSEPMHDWANANGIVGHPKPAKCNIPCGIILQNIIGNHVFRSLNLWQRRFGRRQKSSHITHIQLCSLRNISRVIMQNSTRLNKRYLGIVWCVCVCVLLPLLKQQINFVCSHASIYPVVHTFYSSGCTELPLSSPTHTPLSSLPHRAMKNLSTRNN